MPKKLHLTKAREKLVKSLESSVQDAKVLAAMRKVPREEFVPMHLKSLAYENRPLPIGHKQTISQPLVVAVMTAELQLSPESKVLEIGTGSGYQAAILGELAEEVYTIEIVEPLATQSKALLQRLGYTNITVKYGDGYLGWPEHAPFDRIILTAATPEIPQPLIDQLKIGGKMVLPFGEGSQKLIVAEKNDEGLQQRIIFPVSFVPMTGQVAER